MAQSSRSTKARHWVKGILLVCSILSARITLGQELFDKDIKKAPATRSVSSYLSGEYKQVGNTLLYYNQQPSSIDVVGTFNSY